MLLNMKPPEKELPDIVCRALSEEAAAQIIAPDSTQVSQVLKEHADGRVVLYGDSRSRATRMEIKPKEGVLITIHKNTGVARGMFRLAARFNKIDIISGDNARYELTVGINPDPIHSPYNPIYDITDEKGSLLGTGSGNIDTVIAWELLWPEHMIPGRGTGALSEEVITWIKAHL